MAVIFFDTSALFRRYDTTEPGSGRVRALCRRPAGHVLLIVRITAVEIASALNRKLREAQLAQRQRGLFWQTFRRHLHDQYHLIPLDEQLFERAERLLFSHPLRAYDAVQLAGALRSLQVLARLTRDFRFCTADRVQAQAAAREGLAIELIQ